MNTSGRKSQAPDDTADRPTKRLCTEHDLKSISDEAGLPPELWALVMPFLPYKDNIRCSILNRTFLKDVPSRVKLITVFSPNEMRVGPVARRFSAVETIYIACLYRGDHIMHCGEYYSKRKEDDDELVDVVVSDETVSLAAPFLSAFPVLKTYCFGGYVAGNNSFVRFYDDWDDFTWDGYDNDIKDIKWNTKHMDSLMVSLGGAYRSGLLKTTAKNAEQRFFCTNIFLRKWNKDRCPVCCSFLENFPLDEVLAIVSAAPLYGPRAAPRNVCATIDDAFGMIMKRPGGRASLSSIDFFLSNLSDDALDAFENFGLRS